jgi:two-component system, OmpR family, response regulator MtrA
MISAKALIISGDLEAAQIWSYILGQRGITTAILSPLDEDSTARRPPEHAHDLIIIDVHGSEMNVVRTIQRLRTETTVPILLLLPQDDETRILEAYDAGVDEVIVGGISPRLFQAKVIAWQRRSWTVPTSMLDTFQVGDLRLEPSQRQLVTASGAAIKLTSLEFRLLHLLMSNPGQVLQSSVIVARMWGAAGEGDTNLLKNVVYRVRRKIELNPAQPHYIQSAPGEGYVFIAHQPD